LIGSYQFYLKGITFVFIVLFVYTGTGKLIQIGQFQDQIAKFPFVSEYASWIAWGIPLVELVIAVLFLFPKQRVTALYAGLSLLSAFTIYIFSILKFSDSTPCPCGGVISAMGWNEHILFNGILMLLALIGIRLTKNDIRRYTIPKDTT